MRSSSLFKWAWERLQVHQELFPIAPQLVGLWMREFSLVLSKGPDFHYRRKRYATKIRGMAPIKDPIDPLQISAAGLHSGVLDVLEERLV